MDATTIEAARLGDRDAQARLLLALQDTWFRFCLGILGNSDAAADATQETALRFLRQLPRFRGESELRTWSLGIALNVVRESKRKSHHVAQTLDVDLAAEQRSANDAAEHVEERARLKKLLAELPERQREAIVLRFFEELSTDESAQAMGCAAGTVKATVHQALRALRKKFEQSR